MTGKFKLILLILCMLSVSAAAQASPFFPFAPGYTATYSCSQGNNTWTFKMKITGTANLGGYQWWVVNLINFNGDGTTQSNYWRLTDTALYAYGNIGPQFQIGPVNFSWTHNDPEGFLETVTIVAIAPVTVPAGTFSNVYELYYGGQYAYWKPGVGLIKYVDAGDPTNPVTRVLTSLSRGAKTAALGLLLDN